MNGFVVLLFLGIIVVNAVRMHKKKSAIKQLDSNLQNAQAQIASPCRISR